VALELAKLGLVVLSRDSLILTGDSAAKQHVSGVFCPGFYGSLITIIMAAV